MSEAYNIVYFYRKPRYTGNFSVEILFDTIRQHLPIYIKSKKVVSRYESNGFWRRVYITLEAAIKQGAINHVTGDVHFLTYLLRKNKTILTIHDCGFMNHPSSLIRFILKLFWLTIPIKCSAIVTVVSETTKQEVLKYVACKPDKIKVIGNFISPAFQPKIKSFNKIKPVLLQVGTAPNKNLERLIEAIGEINCKLDIIGKLSEEQVKLLKIYKVEYFNSYNLTEAEIISKYESCDILTFVSTYEGFGMPIIEAQTVGRVVLTSNISAMAEVAGDSACLVDPYSISNIRNGIISLIENEEYRNKLIERGFKNKEKYQLTSVINSYISLYNYLLKNNWE